MSLVAFLAWVGLGSDGLSSSCYGPEEAFIALGHHQYLAVFLAMLMALTVFIISASYSQTIDEFLGGGGYWPTQLGRNAGLVSGCADCRLRTDHLHFDRGATRSSAPPTDGSRTNRTLIVIAGMACRIYAASRNRC